MGFLASIRSDAGVAFRWQQGRQGSGYDTEIFRPDACAHGVTRVGGGSRYMLSLGWVMGGDAGET